MQAYSTIGSSTGSAVDYTHEDDRRYEKGRPDAGGRFARDSAPCGAATAHSAPRQLRPHSTASAGPTMGASGYRGLDPTFSTEEMRYRTPGASLDIAVFSQNELLVMLAALLTKITTTNDRLHGVSGEPTCAPRADSPLLAFHARNVPSISIQAYLMRILKYCPMSSDIFLSLLVYFDRMTRAGVPIRSQDDGNVEAVTAPEDGSVTAFAVDSFNVHRLVIAAIVVASKFCSDVFYTNSRYAKVGGLPLAELNHLEFQFLLLNDFRLLIPLEDLQRYADQLLVFWEHETASRGG